ncbi:hypothetical protein ORI20_32965, partial [Mycobacterium sp. CVI_P3]
MRGELAVGQIDQRIVEVGSFDPGLEVVALLCPAVLCARPPETPAGVAVMARVRAHNEIDGKTI